MNERYKVKKMKTVISILVIILPLVRMDTKLPSKINNQKIVGKISKINESILDLILDK